MRPDGSDLERYLPDGSAIAFSRCTDLWTCETRLVDPDGASDRMLFGELGRQTVHVIWQPGQDQ